MYYVLYYNYVIKPHRCISVRKDLHVQTQRMLFLKKKHQDKTGDSSRAFDSKTTLLILQSTVNSFHVLMCEEYTGVHMAWHA